MPFQIVICHPTLSNNCNKVLSSSVKLLELFSIRSNHLLHSLHQTQSIKNRLMSEQENEGILVLQEIGHVNNAILLIFWYFQCLRCITMYSEVGVLLISSGTQVQPQVVLEPNFLPYYLSVSIFSNPKHGDNFMLKVIILKKVT